MFSMCASQMREKENRELYGRNLSSAPLQPYLNVRPVMTKYSKLPIVDPRKKIHESLKEMPVYNTDNVFNPGNRNAPWSGFVTNVNVESELRNQIFALNKGCTHSTYVPNSNSDLYVEKMVPDNNYHGPNKELFHKDKFNCFNPNPNPSKIGFALFNNSTRQQLKDT